MCPDLRISIYVSRTFVDEMQEVILSRRKIDIIDRSSLTLHASPMKIKYNISLIKETTTPHGGFQDIHTSAFIYILLLLFAYIQGEVAYRPESKFGMPNIR